MVTLEYDQTAISQRGIPLRWRWCMEAHTWKGARLHTDLLDPLADMVAFYQQLMTIAEQGRDTKGCRFGVRLEWTRFQIR